MNTRTLKHTGRVVPASPAYETGALKQMRMSDGHAMTLPLKIAGKVVGVIEDQGTGGGAWFRPNSAADRLAFAQYVEDWKTLHADEALWSPEEQACEEIVSEAELAKTMTRNAKTAILLREPQSDVDAWSEDGFAYMSAKHATLEQVLPQAVERGLEVWTGSEWTPAAAITKVSL